VRLESEGVRTLCGPLWSAWSWPGRKRHVAGGAPAFTIEASAELLDAAVNVSRLASGLAAVR
jgi:hypothetical protein